MTAFQHRQTPADPLLAPLPEPQRAWTVGHGVQLYEQDAFLHEAVAAFACDGLRAAQPVVLVARSERREAMVAEMRNRGIDPADLAAGRDFVWLDAQEILREFMEGATPNRTRFQALLDSVMEQVLKDRPYAVPRVFGEMVDVLWSEGNITAAVALEEMWNDLAIRYSFNLLCAYRISTFGSETHTAAFESMCRAHHEVRPTESYLATDEAERLKRIALLQQRAAALEAELANRRQLEATLRETLTQRRRVEEELRRRELELRDFLENGLEPMHWVGPNGNIVWANRAELQMLGYGREEYVGRHVSDVHADPAVVADILDRLTRGEDLRNYPATLRCKDGSVRRVLISSNVYWQDGKFIHTRCFSRDVTDYRPPPVA